MIIQLVLSCLLLSCSNINRDIPVDKENLRGYDYRLFQGTPAWELAKAVQDEDEEEINEIVSKNPRLINYQEPTYGSTLLMLTILNQQIKSFKALIDNHADMNIHDTCDGASAIIESVKFHRYDVDFLEILIENGANVNDIEVGERKAYNSTRNTPLISAARVGKMEFVELLVKNGAEINYQNEYGRSAFSQSILQSEYEVAYCLLRNGADYTHPIFYRPDLSIPIDKQDPNDKGKPIYLVDLLREKDHPISSEQHEYKMKIAAFLKDKGLNTEGIQ